MLDLTLVRTFVLLYETGSVTRAAESLGVTQPSVSHALARLRRQLGDQLFLRSAGGLVPTATARRLYPDLRVGIDVIDSAVAGARRFDPSTSDRQFRLLATDLGELALLPAVVAELASRAPRSRLEILPLDFATAPEQLRQGRADAVICTPRLPDGDLRRDVLFREYYVGLCSRGHPRIGPSPSLDEFAAERHAAVDAAIGHAQAVEVLGSEGIDADVGLLISHFAALPRILERSELLAIVPSTVAAWCSRAADVRSFALPVPSLEVEVALYTHDRPVPSSAVDWLRDVVVDVLTELTVGAPPTRAGPL